VRSMTATIVMSLLASVAIGGLSGTYTIKPEGGGDYLSLYAAGVALTDSGMSGNCVFEIYGDTLEGRFGGEKVAGSETWTTTFRPGPGADPLLLDGQFYGGWYHNVKIENLRFEHVWFTMGPASGWRISGCRFASIENWAVDMVGCTSDTVDGNTFDLLPSADAPALQLRDGADNVLFNNVVNCESCGVGALVHLDYERNTRFVFNTLRISPRMVPMSYCFEAWCERPCDVRNNVFVLARPAESTNACVGIRPIGDSVVPDYNCYFVESLGHACASPDPFYPYLYT